MQSFLGQSHRERRLRTATLLAAGAGLLFTAWVTLGDPFGAVQSTFVDSLFLARDGSPNIVITRIGEDDLAAYGRIQQWPRSLHAAAIANLQDAGARVIVYDIIFADPGTDDAALVGAVAEADAIILAVAGGSPARAPDGSLVYGTISKPVAPLRETGAVLGHANVLADSDGRVRRLPLVISGDDGQQRSGVLQTHGLGVAGAGQPDLQSDEPVYYRPGAAGQAAESGEHASCRTSDPCRTPCAAAGPTAVSA